MKKSHVIARLKEMGLRPETISFYSDVNGNESPDTEYSECEISGKLGQVVDCTALGTNGKVYAFQALDDLVAGALGKVAGAI